MGGLFEELRRRNIFRVAGVYAVVGWLLAQAAVVLETSLGFPAWFDGVIVGFLIIAFPIAMVLAWAFEVTPEGVKLTAKVPEGTSIAPKTGRKLDYVIIGGLALVGMLIVADRMMPGEIAANINSEPPIAAASIAVLPFADLSPDGDQEYFSDGIAEEILNVLVRVEGLAVASRTSSFQFKGREIGIPMIAQELRVRHVVEGSVRKAGDTIRITAQLIDAEGDRHLWSDTFDRPLTAENIFEIQDEIATAIVEALSDVMGLSETAEIEVAAVTDDVSAYELYLKARTLVQGRSGLVAADEFLARAIEQDPDFAKAWELRAVVYLLGPDYETGLFDPQLAQNLTLEFASKALALEPNSATALAVLALLRMNNIWYARAPENIVEIVADFKRALEIDSHDAQALNWLGMVYASAGELELALDYFDRCLVVEEFNFSCLGNKSDALSSMGKDEEALEIFNNLPDMGLWGGDDSFKPGLLARADDRRMFKIHTNSKKFLYGWRGHDRLFDAFQNLNEDHRELAKEIRQFTETNPNTDLAWVSLVLIPLGEYDLVPWSDEMWDRSYVGYRQSDGFKANIRDYGTLDYWREAGFPPQCRPLGDDDFECD